MVPQAWPQQRALPARKVSEVVSWAGVQVSGVGIRYHGAGAAAPPPGALAPLPAVQGPEPAPREAGEGSDWSEGEGDIPNEFDVDLSSDIGRQEPNVRPLQPIRSLASEHRHNANLVRQFEELSRSFTAWRPVRGDGNCYYRAVLFAWIERCVAVGNLESLRRFSSDLKPHRQNPVLARFARTCNRLLRGWIGKRSQCTGEAALRDLLMEIGDDFNRPDTDRAFIFCLRYLVADYLRAHAHEQLEPTGSNMDLNSTSSALTYETWAQAMGAKNIEEYCERDVCVMNKDAADHVQHVCPRVLRTIVRICMVDRESAQFQAIDHGTLRMQAGRSVRSAMELASVGAQRGPEIYLLLKPGHYDILIPQADIVGRLLDPERLSGAARAPGERHGAAPELPADAAWLRRHSDQRWRALLQLTGELMEAFKSVTRCLEDKLVEEMQCKRKRVGSTDEALFEAQLSSVVDPVRSLLGKLQCFPEDSPFSQDREPPRSVPSAQLLLLPQLTSLLAAQGAPPPLPQAAFAPAARAAAAAVAAPAPAPAVPAAPAPAGAAASLHKGGRPAPVPVPVAAAAPAGAAEARPAPAQHAGPRAAGHECCICMRPGAEAVAQCGCGYHLECLREYAEMEHKPPQDICCHLHDRPLGGAFVAQHLPGFSPPRGAVARGGAAGAAGALQEGAFGPAAQQQPRQQHLAQPPYQALPAEAVGQLDALARGQLEHRSSAKRLAPLAVDAEPPPLAPFGSMPQSGMLGSMRLIPQSAVLAQTGNLGGAFGIPCVICFGEDGILKTLHCQYKVHKSCLKSFWQEKVTSLSRLTDIRCPAEVAGCTEALGESDLRGVVTAADIQAAEQSIRDVDDRNMQLIEQLRRQTEEYKPVFTCAICLTEHEVEGCCTLPCQHRFCFESLQYHFDIIVRERRLSKLTCPVDGCGCNLRSQESIHIFQQCLSEQTYHKLLEFLTRDDPHIFECKHVGCEERVFLDDGDDSTDLACPNGHRFCGGCEHGPHPGVSCEVRLEQVDRERKNEEAARDHEEAWESALALGWKPCPRQCKYGGGYKAQEECDHVTCECGFEFCWDCGVERQVALLHDNRWHKPSCRYHTPPHEVAERPRAVAGCPECKKMSWGRCCPFPADDGYPHSYVRRRRATSSGAQQALT